MRDYRDKTAIVGIGATPGMKQSGVSVLTLTTRAIKEAIDDAGLTPKDIDGITGHGDNSATPHQIASALGIPELKWSGYYGGGGFASNNLVATAAAMVNTGVCNYVVVYRSMNRRSGTRGGGWGRFAAGPPKVPGFPGNMLYGMATPPQGFAMQARTHMEKYGTTSEQLGWIAVTTRYHASMNPLSQMPTPITLEDHQTSRWVVEPFHLLDCCLETDQGCALIVTTAERAKSLKHRPVNILGAAVGHGPMEHGEMFPDLSELYGKYTAPRVFEMAGVTPKDIDAVELYDCFTYITLVQLEDYGFVKKGEGGPFVEGGQRIRLGGELPVNTHGGNLSEAYRHGLGHVIEGARQLRHELPPERQVKNAELILTTGQGGPHGAALILRKGDKV